MKKLFILFVACLMAVSVGAQEIANTHAPS